MAVDSQDVLEKEKILQVIQSLFFTSPVFMLFERKEYSVKPLKLIPEGLIVQSIGRSDRDERVLFVRANEKVFEISFDLLGINSGRELLYPRKLNIRSIQEPPTNESKTSKKIFISKLIREEEIIPNILSENSQLKKIIETYQSDLRNKLSTISVY
ncbi:MAG: hypothetical protein N3A69_05820, partial [Leptospiraceae bacterium]|nr:hypothetical protein [Leptospiraceae bacterium]